jgi:molecular chaperone HtpG
MDGQLDTPMVSMLEQKLEKTQFTRVDADIADRLIQKDDQPKSTLSADDTDNLSQVFNTQMPELEKTNFMVDVQSLGETSTPVMIIQNEYMRRMKDISHFQQGMSFYQQMPDSYTLVVNSDHPLVKKVLEDTNANTTEKLKPILSEIKGQEARLAALHQSQSGKKPEEITQEEKDDVKNTENAISEQRSKKTEVLSEYAKGNKVVHQLIDLALLQNGMLKGEALAEFVKRSVELI